MSMTRGLRPGPTHRDVLTVKGRPIADGEQRSLLGESEQDEIYSGGQHQGERGQDAAGEVAASGVPEWGGEVCTAAVPECRE